MTKTATLKKQILIYGSCVSRDTFEFLDRRFELLQYIARQSFISVGNESPQVDRQIPRLKSAFQERMVRGDIYGDAVRKIAEVGEDADLIVFDLIDERGGVIETSTGYVSKLAEVWNAGGKQVLEKNKHIAFGTDEHFALWRPAADRIIDLLRSRNWLQKSVVLRTPWVDRDSEGQTVHYPDWMMDPKVANSRYQKYYDYLLANGLKIVSLPDSIAETTPDHKWGPSPFHYSERGYRYLAQELERLLEDLDSHRPVRATLSRRQTHGWGSFREYHYGSTLDIATGVLTPITIRIDDYPVDLLVENNRSTTTLVIFHAALGQKQKFLPVFTGRSISDGIGVNRIFVSDASLLAGEDIGLAWYLGTRDLLLEAVIEELVECLQESFSAKNLVFFGMSGGGFAALNYSRMFPGSLAIPVNPQTNILKYNAAHWTKFAENCFGVEGEVAARQLIEDIPSSNQCGVYESSTANRVLYVQNAKDPHVISHMLPWLRSTQWAKEHKLIMEDWGNGHQPPPAPFLRAMLSPLDSSNGDWDNYFEQLIGAGINVVDPSFGVVKQASPYAYPEVN